MVIIPSELNGKKVTAIGAGAFSLSMNLQEVTIQEGIEFIDDYAFSLCSLLVKVNLPESLKHLEENAFVSCSEEISFSAPDGSYADSWINGRK